MMIMMTMVKTEFIKDQFVFLGDKKKNKQITACLSSHSYQIVQ